MSAFTKIKSLLRLSGFAVLLTVPAFADGISASATFSGIADPSVAGLYDYSLTLSNTGTTTIGTFWFAWVPGAGFLPVAATNVSSPADWNFRLTNSGKGIQWTTASLLQPGQSLTGFTFSDTASPSQLLGIYPGTGPGAGDPITTSFVYAGAPNVGVGSQFVVSQVTPEPGSLLLLATGLVVGSVFSYAAPQRFRHANPSQICLKRTKALRLAGLLHESSSTTR